MFVQLNIVLLIPLRLFFDITSLLNKNLFSLASGLVAQDDVSCYKAVSVGEQSLQRIGTDIKQFGSLKLKRADVAKTMSSSTSTVIGVEIFIEVDTTQLFLRKLCTIHSPDDLQDCFAFELATLPMALFDSSGLVRKIKKAAFYYVFDIVPE
uniref:Uncharacterized protein n=1 Tax=Timema monikensis TaxID=170555 RepID=A0A7R9HR52_9NEOP|nr:unnamed protein product [Timema monikensis]